MIVGGGRRRSAALVVIHIFTPPAFPLPSGLSRRWAPGNEGDVSYNEASAPPAVLNLLQYDGVHHDNGRQLVPRRY